jgi:hypothetical protein
MSSDGSRTYVGDLQAELGDRAQGREAGERSSSLERSRLFGATPLPGPRYIAAYLLALPVIVVAFASTGADAFVSWAISLCWLVLAPTALYSRAAALALPILSALFLALTVTLLSFNSTAFIVDVTATAIMFLVSVPRHWSRAAVPRAPSPARS